MPLEGDLQKTYLTFKDELLKQPGIKAVSSAQQSIGSGSLITCSGRERTLRN
jgi:hypothetical protein